MWEHFYSIEISEKSVILQTYFLKTAITRTFGKSLTFFMFQDCLFQLLMQDKR